MCKMMSEVNMSDIVDRVKKIVVEHLSVEEIDIRWFIFY